MQFTDDVTPYEEMKIGLLNGSHLALTYLGFLRGYRFVHETLGDPLLRRYVRAFMDRDVAPLLAPVPGIDLERYKDSLVERFANRAIADQLERVCSDGSSKFPKFIVPTANRLIAAGRPLERWPWWWRPGRCTWAGSTSMANATRFPIRAPPNARRWLPNATAWAGACSAWRPCSARRSRPRRPSSRPSSALYDSLRRHGVSETLRQVLGE
ncbi:hypothetical protein P4110_03370 [Pseudomonas aeruginosa]|nr:hypothetical protein [Pseudomonas aeruginosa]